MHKYKLKSIQKISDFYLAQYLAGITWSHKITEVYKRDGEPFKCWRGRCRLKDRRSEIQQKLKYA